MKPKEYLASIGVEVKQGRGRLSAENVAIIKEAVASGVRIEGYSVENVPATSKSEKATEVKRVPVTNEKVIEELYIRYPVGEYKVIRTDTNEVLPGPKAGLPEVCNTCRVSLTGHICDNPTILGNIPVKVVPIG